MKSLTVVFTLLALLAAGAIFDPLMAEDTEVICHVPPGNPAAEQTITVGAKAAEAHLAKHPLDTAGDCEEERCESEDDCEEGEICEEGVCQENGGECDSEADCDEGEICDDGVCRDREDVCVDNCDPVFEGCFELCRNEEECCEEP